MPYNLSLPYPIAFLADNIKSSYTHKKNFYGDSGVTLQVRNECQQCQVAFPSKSRVAMTQNLQSMLNLFGLFTLLLYRKSL